MRKLLFVCVHNSGRSQVAEAFAKRLGAGVIEAESAGTRPAREINPTVVQAMFEIGYDLTGQRPKLMALDMMRSADRVITMGCGVAESLEGGACPATFGPTEDWGIEDPEGKPIEKVREIRDLIKARVEKLIEEMTTGEG